MSISIPGKDVIACGGSDNKKGYVMNASQVAHLCALYDFGDSVGEPQEMTGGFVHRVWRLTTTRGSYAIKQLNSIISQYPNIYDIYRTSERIATVMRHAGVPAIAAMKGCDNDTLHVIEDAAFQVYEWVDGTRLSSHAVEPERVRLIGSILAKMHNQQVPETGLAPPDLEPFTEDDWDMLTFQAADRGLNWAQRVRTALPRIIEWSAWVDQVEETLEKTLVVSHRDLDQKNVLWRDEQHPAIIDWEAAGLVNPTMEVVGAAFSWSGLVRGMPDEGSFTALLEGYISSGGIIRDTGLTAIYGVMGNWLDWLHFNILRSFALPENERQLGESETLQTLTLLYALANNAEKWATWVDQYR